MNKLVALQAFRHVVELGSFTAAADALQVSPAMASKYLAQLEQELGARLLTRSTRSVRLTEQGETYYQHISQLLDELTEADLEVGAGSTSPTGELRLTAPIDLGESLLHPIISDYQRQHPDVTVSLDLTDRQVDLFAEQYDLALRVGSIKTPDLVARKFTTLELLLCASPDYLDSASPLNHPSELSAHNCLLNPQISDSATWQFVVDGKPFSINVTSNLQINRAQMLARSAIEGRGIIYVPRIMLQEALADGSLVELLPEYILPAMDVFLVYPERSYLPAKVRCFIDTVVKNYS